jgi:two-component system response regulator NreC
LKKTTTIVLADDHQVVREGLRLLLEARAEFSVVAEASDGLQAVEITERLQPDVLVVDLVMPGLGGLDVTRRVTKRAPRTRVVILSMHSSDALVLEALRNGATAYVLKGFSAAELVQAIRDAVEGRRYLSPPLSEKALEIYVQKARPAEADLYQTLTQRERQVLHMAAEGLSSSLTGERLGISPRTVETHRANVMRKLGLRSRAELIRYALQRGILSLDPPVSPGASKR